MLLNDIRHLYNNKSSHYEFLLEYSKIANTLMYQDIDFIREVTNYLILETSKLYNGKMIVDKTDLTDKQSWYSNSVRSFENKTGGTTGNPFCYRIWSDIYKNIEGTNHYLEVAEEFGIFDNCKILHLYFEDVNDKTSNLINIIRSNNPVLSHGFGKSAEVHVAIANKDFFNNYYKYYENIINYAIINKIDIISGQNSAISALEWNSKRLNIKNKLCRLISATGTKLEIGPVRRMKEMGIIESWCDHMRCWDGGVTFITCKYGTYHLMDSLAWAYTDDYKLISYDYFSVPSPFVRYWNGDYADISNVYDRCKCGRAFRNFELGRTRSKIRQVSDISHIQESLTNNGIIDKIKRVDIVREFIRVFVKSSLSNNDKELITKSLPNGRVQFTVEEEDI